MVHLKALKDIIMATDSGCFVLMILIDLSAAFDSLDRNVLLLWLEEVAGRTSSAPIGYAFIFWIDVLCSKIRCHLQLL